MDKRKDLYDNAKDTQLERDIEIIKQNYQRHEDSRRAQAVLRRNKKLECCGDKKRNVQVWWVRLAMWLTAKVRGLW